MLFSEIIGQDEIKDQLRRAVRQGRIPHAQLLSGQRGVGKMQLALAYAQYVACEHRTDDDACGVCPTCQQFHALQHPDLHLVFPIAREKDTDVCDTYVKQFREMVQQNTYFDLQTWYQTLKVEKKQAVIYEKESSEILRKLSLKAYGDGYKFVIIWLAEKMNDVCANKLLKILEEPAPKTVFILVSEQPERLLPTILSRVQQIRVRQISEADIAKALVERNHIADTQQAQAIAHMAAGSYLRALQIISDDDNQSKNFEWYVKLMRNAYRVGQRREYMALVEMKEWCDDIAKLSREKQKDFLEYANRQTRENYIANFNIPQINYQTQAESQFTSRFAAFVTSRNIEALATQFETAQRQIEQNANAKIVFFDLCLNVIVAIKNK